MIRRTWYFILLVVALLAVNPVQAQQSTPDPNSNLSQLNGINFANVNFSTTNVGPAQTYFPVGTPEVYLRFDYQNIPAGSVLVRQWYRDGVLYIQRQDVWSTLWGPTGRLTHISLYDYINGLTPGYYHVIVSLSGYPAASIIGDFVVAGQPLVIPPPNTTPAFYDLTVSSSAAGANTSEFPAGTTLISARWNYANIPVGAMLRRDWYVNGVLTASVQEPWSGYWGPNGRLTHIALYDYQHGLTPGSYQLYVYLVDYPTVKAAVSWTIDSAPVVQNSPIFGNLRFSSTPGGPPLAIFPHGTTQVYARWDFSNVVGAPLVVRRWFRNDALFIERQEPWLLGTAGTVQNVSIYDLQNSLLPGVYFAQFSIDGSQGAIVSGSFTVQ